MNSESAQPPRSKKLLNWVILGVIVLGIGGGITWAKVVKRHVFPRHWEVVEQGMIYRSGELSTTLVEKTWRQHNIKTVINLHGDVEGERAHQAAAEAAEALGINRLFFPLNGDGVGKISSYVGAIEAIVESRRNNKPCVVHCVAGTYRTGGVIACYRVLVDGWSGQAAYEEMVDEGVKPRPDTPVIAFLNKNIGEIARRLVKAGVIEKAPDPLPVFGPS
ncbi:MAG: dual specificity protein phosphatase family protein [Phycisphaerales bacterium]|nr:dual specificity protein phosphatase family protein [Phycisphaerales bacterium]MCI0631550.1 dual specificity protein phosphatase family protein [Phycisphaerales bacterium]MCI0676289.1 dual specificity protein phosphatase family protein [Phycisphaerales bacterium]